MPVKSNQATANLFGMECLSLDDRKATILSSLVEEYIRNGDAISSSAVLELSGLFVSAATIRTELAALERDGWLDQPHTSAGRTPTEKAFRWYVDHAKPGLLRVGTRRTIQEFFGASGLDLSRLLKATGELLADVTRYPAIVIGPALFDANIRGANLVRMGESMVMLVLVTDAGKVTQDLIHLDYVVSDGEVDAAEIEVAELLVGFDANNAKVRLKDRQLSAAPTIERLVSAAVTAAERSSTLVRDVHISGASRPASIWEDLASVHRVLELLEREATVLSLLASVESGIVIQIGTDLPLSETSDLAVISSSYEAGEHNGGTIGGLGPLRMDYRRTISVLEEVSESLAGYFGS